MAEDTSSVGQTEGNKENSTPDQDRIIKHSVDSQLEPQKTECQQLLKLQRDLENMVIKYARSESENLSNKNKVDDLDKKLKRAIKDNDSLANRIKLLTNDKNQLTDTLNAKLAQLTVLEQKNSSLSNVQSGKMKELEERISELETTNAELAKQIETYKQKEGELLDFSERLSMKQLLLQAELDKALEQNPDDYRVQYERVSQQRDELFRDKQNLESQLETLKNELLCEKTMNQVKQEDIEIEYRKNIDKLENEIKVMRRKHQIATRELLKQMKQLQVR